MPVPLCESLLQRVLAAAIGSELMPDPGCLKPVLLSDFLELGIPAAHWQQFPGPEEMWHMWLMIHTLYLLLHIVHRSLQNQQTCLRDCRRPLKNLCLLSMKQDMHFQFKNTVLDFAWYLKVNQSGFHVVCDNSYLVLCKPILQKHTPHPRGFTYRWDIFHLFDIVCPEVFTLRCAIQPLE